MSNYTTEQESFWEGSFGNEYIKRNQSSDLIAVRTALFASALKRSGRLRSALELGSNIGLNERVLNILFPGIKMETVEINKNAAEECGKIPNVIAHHGSILDFECDKTFDLTFTSGVLIHINPERLKDVYDRLYRFSAKYILVNEYYNPTPVEVNYRGETGKLFKRDFAGEILDMYPDVELIDYGFVYHRDISFPTDDATWFLMRKKTAAD